jgi:putative membrane protein
MRFPWVPVGACLTVGLVAGSFVTLSGQSVRNAGESSASAGTVVARSAVDTSAVDQLFVSGAAMANMAEIQFGHLAIKKAKNAAVIKFAGQMVDDHIKAQNNLADAAEGAGIQWPKRLDDKYAAIHQRLSALSGPDFDREYLRSMIAAHQDVEKTLVARVAENQDAAFGVSGGVTEWSAKTLQAVRAHLKATQELAGKFSETP